jgi:hypothetical protein
MSGFKVIQCMLTMAFSLNLRLVVRPPKTLTPEWGRIL